MSSDHPWYEQDTFWETFEPTMFGERRWSDAPTEVENAIALLNLQPGKAVLDLCCGVGRHSLELARRGFAVTGVVDPVSSVCHIRNTASTIETAKSLSPVSTAS